MLSLSFLTQCLLWASVQFAATLSPGPAFFIVTRKALIEGRSAGIQTAIGCAIGVGIYAALALAGLSVLLVSSTTLYSALQYIGAAYLIFLGVKNIRAAFKSFRLNPQAEDARLVQKATTPEAACAAERGPLAHIVQGALTNLLNPKALIFFTAILSQFMVADMSVGVKTLYGVISMIIEALWFITLSLLLTHKNVQAHFTRFMHWGELVFGVLLIGLGLRLALPLL